MKLLKRCLLCLKELPVFSRLDQDEFTGVCLSAGKKVLQKGTVLFNQGDGIDTIFLIKAGKLKLLRGTESGRELIINILGPGELLGETTLFQAQEQPYSAVAIEEVKLCCFSRRQLEELIKNNPDIAVKIITALGQRLYSILERIEEAALPSTREKLLLMFNRLAAEYGRETSAGTVIELNLTQQDLADMIGVSRVMVAQVLKEMKKEAIISWEKKRYILLKDKCLTHYFHQTS